MRNLANNVKRDGFGGDYGNCSGAGAISPSGLSLSMTARPSAKAPRNSSGAAHFAEIGADSLDSGKVIPYLAIKDFGVRLKRAAKGIVGGKAFPKQTCF